MCGTNGFFISHWRVNLYLESWRFKRSQCYGFACCYNNLYSNWKSSRLYCFSYPYGNGIPKSNDNGCCYPNRSLSWCMFYTYPIWGINIYLCTGGTSCLSYYHHHLFYYRYQYSRLYINSAWHGECSCEPNTNSCINSSINFNLYWICGDNVGNWC